MTEISTIRHQMIFNSAENHNIPIHIIGCGALGSRIFASLIELGLINIKCYDFDRVEAHNLANQIFMNHHIGLTKVEALKQYYKEKIGSESPPDMEFHNTEVSSSTYTEGDFTGIVFLMVDTMKARTEIFRDLLLPSEILCMIDGRMASSYGDVKAINMFSEEQKESWENSLFSDEEGEVSPCGASISVGPTAAIIANMCVWQAIHTMNDPLAHESNINVCFKPFTLNVGI